MRIHRPARAAALLVALAVPVLAGAQPRPTADDQQYQAEYDRLDERFGELRDAGRYRAALAVGDSSISYRTAFLRRAGHKAADDLVIAQRLWDLSEIHGAMGNLSAADSLYEVAIGTFERVEGPNGVMTGVLRMQTMLSRRQQGRLALADSMLAGMLAYADSVFGPDSQMRQILVEAYRSDDTPAPRPRQEEGSEMGDLELFEALNAVGQRHAAITLGDSIIRWLDQRGRPGQGDLVVWLDMVAMTRFQHGDLHGADTLFERSIALRVARGDSLAVLETATMRAGLHAALGRHARADSLLARVVEMRRVASGAWSPEHIAEILTRAAAARAGGADALSDSLYREAATLARRIKSADHASIASVYSTLGVFADSRGNHARADTFFARAAAIRPDRTGSDLLERMAMARLHGRHARADSLLRRYEEATAGAGDAGRDDLGYAAALHDLALYRETQGRTGDAVRLLSRAVEIASRGWFGELSYAQRTALSPWMPVAGHLVNGVLSLSVRHPADADLARLGLALVLRNKGMEQDVTADAWAWYRSDPVEAVVVDSLVRLRARLSALASVSPPRDTLQHRIEYERLQAEHAHVEAQLGGTSRRTPPREQAVNLEQVQAAIPPDAALLELVWYDAARRPIWGATEPPAPRYAAYVLTRAGAPRFVDLGNAAVLDSLVARFRTVLDDPQRGDPAALAGTLGDVILRPLRPFLGDARHLLVSPDGSLNLLPFAALADADGRYLLESYTITYLTSGRDLPRMRGRAAVPAGPPLVVAAPEFQQAGEAPPPAARHRGTPGAHPAGLGSLWWGPLPGTDGEAEVLREIFPAAAVLQGRDATESRLKGAASPGILHVATHGFFLPDSADAAAVPWSAVYSAETQLLSGTLVPVGPDVFDAWPVRWRDGGVLLQAGLALAGANVREGGGGEDGILTALEVSGLDLAGTELVVLSACETGIGQASNGRGVYGLRRALVLAGARAQVTTLWRVNDDATRNVMAEYYERLRRGEGRSAALRAVQLGMLEGHAHPNLWAAFIPLGDWTPLPAGVLDGAQAP